MKEGLKMASTVAQYVANDMQGHPALPLPTVRGTQHLVADLIFGFDHPQK